MVRNPRAQPHWMKGPKGLSASRVDLEGPYHLREPKGLSAAAAVERADSRSAAAIERKEPEGLSAAASGNSIDRNKRDRSVCDNTPHTMPAVAYRYKDSRAQERRSRVDHSGPHHWGSSGKRTGKPRRSPFAVAKGLAQCNVTKATDGWRVARSARQSRARVGTHAKGIIGKPDPFHRR